jgi:hypothetical protein
MAKPEKPSVLPNKTARTKVSESKNILTKTAGWVTVTPNPPHPIIFGE